MQRIFERNVEKLLIQNLRRCIFLIQNVTRCQTFKPKSVFFCIFCCIFLF